TSQVVKLRVMERERHRRKRLTPTSRYCKSECTLRVRRGFPTCIRDILSCLVDWTVFDARGQSRLNGFDVGVDALGQCLYVRKQASLAGLLWLAEFFRVQSVSIDKCGEQETDPKLHSPLICLTFVSLLRSAAHSEIAEALGSAGSRSARETIGTAPA